MRINRALLYAGTFLLAIGAMLVAVEQGVLATSTVSDALRFWPLAVIAVGAGLVLRRSRLSLAGGLLAAAIPGLVLGGTIGVVPRISGDCGIHREPVTVLTQAGQLGDSAQVSLSMDCGTLTVGTADGNGWRFDATNTGGHAPSLSTAGGSLYIESPNGGVDALRFGRNAWNLTLPRAYIAELALAMNLGQARVDLLGAHVGRIEMTTNAGDFELDASGATLRDLFAEVNLGLLSVDLPARSDTSATFEIGAGGVKICGPADLGMRVITDEVATQVNVGGLKQTGSTWQSANYASAEHHADIDITGSFGAVDINPIGGCK